jgi:thioesterase domain-containing protein
MAHSAETRANVRRLYIEGMPLTGAATASRVAYETAREWKAKAEKNGDNWDTARAAYRVSDQGVDDLNRQLVEDFARQVITTTRELEAARIEAADKAQLLAQLADAYAKFSRAFARINPAYSGLSVALDTLKTLADYLSAHDKAALKTLQPHLEEVGAILGKRYG